SGIGELSSWDAMCIATIQRLDRGELAWEEATPYLYFQDCLKGRKMYPSIRHVIIDEAQDYTPLQYAYLKSLFPRSRMTLLGDIHQAIYTSAVTSPSILAPEQLFEATPKKITLEASYRSTQQ